jgi:hypothetical protein
VFERSMAQLRFTLSRWAERTSIMFVCLLGQSTVLNGRRDNSFNGVPPQK